MTVPVPVGFIGVGAMGEPMLLNLLRAGIPLVVLNRTSDKCRPLAEAGALVATTIHEVFVRPEASQRRKAGDASKLIRNETGI
jgi:3-hydroxyisobutyrate dehydrogenase